MKKIVQKNWFFFILILVIGILFINRYSYLQTYVVSNPDSSISFSTKDQVLEQTWQPTAKIISGVEMPYEAEDDFSCEIQLEILSDDCSEVLARSVQKVTFQEGSAGSIEFSLGRVNVIPGERYRIRFSLFNSSQQGTLKIASGSNYGGCSVAGENVKQGAALTVTFGKYSRLFWLVASMFPLLCFSLFSMVLTERKWEESVALSLFAEGIILYCFGWSEHLETGIFTVYLLSVLGLLAAIFIFNKKNLTIKSLSSPGLWIYAAMFVVIILTSYGDWLGMRDDMRHWGIAVQDMFYYNSFAKHIGSTVILPTYLPFTALIEYVFEYMNGIFSEDILFISYQTMLLSVLVILCKPLRNREGRKLFLPVMVAMICVPVIFFSRISNSIMVDSLMMAIVAYVLICYYSEQMTWFNRIRIGCAIAALTLIKDMGLVLAGMAALIMFMDTVIRQIRKRKLGIRELLYPVFCAGLALALFFSWQIYLSIPEKTSIATAQDADIAVEDMEPDTDEVVVTGQKDEGENKGLLNKEATAIGVSGITLDGLKKIFTGEGEAYQYEVTRNFLIELFEGDTYSFGHISLSAISLLAWIIFLILSLGYFGYWQEDKYRIYGYAAGLCAAVLVLCAFLQVTYWFTFGPYEALELTSLDRYLGTFLGAAVLTTFYLVYDGLQYRPADSRKAEYLVYVLAFLFAVSMPVQGIVVEAKDIEGNTTDEITYGHSQIAEILRSVARRGERAYFICSNSDGYSEYVFRNAICPIVSEHSEWNIVASKEIYEEQYLLYGEDGVDDNAAYIFSVEEWKAQLWECQYLVVFHADELFTKSYGEVFGEEAIDDGCVYRVIHGEEDISLELIGQTGIKGWH